MNWGNKLLVTFIVFGAGIFYLVYRSMHTNYELVEKDYYKTELRYQDIIDGTNRANALKGTVSIQQTEQGLVLQMPDEMKAQVISGTILFYCAYDASRDKKIGLDITTGGVQIVEKGRITPGEYTVKISWRTNGKNYYTERSITIS